jgi:hypothetical protein
MKNKVYKMFRCRDGSLLCELHGSYFQPVLNFTHGGAAVITGLMDTASRLFMPWSI